jgi:uncharacterized protein YybS (DUF2232 family)
MIVFAYKKYYFLFMINELIKKFIVQGIKFKFSFFFEHISKQKLKKLVITFLSLIATFLTNFLVTVDIVDHVYLKMFQKNY